jgi:hypothetical protein
VVIGNEGGHAINCFGGDSAATPQPCRELAVVHGAAAKGRFRQAGLPIESDISRNRS